MSNTIQEFFNLEQTDSNEQHDITPFEKIPPIVQHQDVKDNARDDYHQSRESLKKIIAKGTELIDKLAVVASESESPRAFEVMGGYLKQLAEMNKMLMEMNKDAKEILEEDKDDTDENHGNTYVFYGSTEDLQKALQETKGNNK